MADELDLQTTQAEENQTGDRLPESQDEPLGEGGKKALQAEREARKKLEKETLELKEALKSVNPDEYKRIQQRLEEEERQKQQLNEKLREATSKSRQEIEERDRIIAQKAEEIVDLRKRVAASQAYVASGGSEGISDVTGRSKFEMVYYWISPRIRVEEDGTHTVLTKDLKAPEMRGDGKPKTIDDLMAEVSEDPAFRPFFTPRQPSGGGLMGGGSGRYPGPKKSFEDAILRKHVNVGNLSR